MRSRRSSACLRLAVLASAFLAMFGAATAAQAGSIAYVDQNEIWVSSFDGTQKALLSDGEGDWRVVAAADNGRVLGVRNEAGKVSQLAKIQLWGSDGQTISQGPLPYSTYGWSTYAAPLGLDLSADGIFLAYGYAGQIGSGWFSGHNVVNSDTKTNNTPIGQDGYQWPTMFGQQVVAKQGSNSIAVFQPAGEGPFGHTFTGFIDASGATGFTLQRTDVAATGRLAAMDLDGTTDKIAVVSLSGMTAGAAVGDTVNCFLPATGSAANATFSQDGQFVAWQDVEGIKIAGVPTAANNPCVFSSPPVLISATGSSPSIGGSDVRTLRPTAPGGGTGGGTDDEPASKPLIVTLPAKVTAAALTSKAGLPLKVTVPAGGKIAVTASVPASRLGLKGNKAVVIATGSASPKSAGQVSVKLRLNAKGRKYRKRLRGLTLTLKITQGAKTTTKTIRLR